MIQHDEDAEEAFARGGDLCIAIEYVLKMPTTK
jgi:hypothetical protein